MAADRLWLVRRVLFPSAALLNLARCDQIVWAAISAATVSPSSDVSNHCSLGLARRLQQRPTTALCEPEQVRAYLHCYYLTASVNITHVGSSYTGLATWTSCEDLPPDHAVVTITAAHRRDYFPSRVWLRGTLSYEIDEKDHVIHTIQLRGYYNFGKREIALGPLPGQKPGYGVICDFNLGDDDHADCKIVVPSSLFVCAHFNAARY